MSLNEEFATAPLAFLEKYVVALDEDGLLSDPGFLRKRQDKEALSAGSTIPAAGKCKWSLEKGFNNVVILRPGKPTDDGGFLAHWLPWKSGGTSAYQLDESAHIFFTSQMTGCRLSVLRDETNPKKAQVLHIAGNHPTGAFGRQRDENKAFSDDTKKEAGRARRFSWSSDETYKNNSAFVIGYLTDAGWKFYAQVAKGSTAAGLIEIDKNIELADPHKKILTQ